MENGRDLQPMISVIIPVYNVAGFLERCLKSLMCQTYADLEIVLIDDGSSDGSEKICDQWAEKDARIVVIHQSNAGAAAARNRGLDIAKGQYIMFVDADDYLDKCIIQKLYDTLCGQECACCMCGYVPVNEYGQLNDPVAVKTQMESSGMELVRERYLQKKTIYNVVNPWGKLFRADVWKDLRFAEGLYYEDLDVMPFLYSRCHKISVVPDVGYYYFLRSGSASRGTGTDHKRYTDSVLIREKHFDFYQSIGEFELAISVAEMLLDLIITSACNGWIPKEEKKRSRHIYRKYAKELLRSSKITYKAKLRLVIFGVFREGFYKRFVLKNGK